MTLILHRSVAEFRQAAQAVRDSGKRLGLVPTMGALHAGHLSLVAEARARATEVALTIFVNPTQFGPNEDFARYPRTLEQDLALCREAGVSHVFAPEASEMYPKGERTRVQVSGLTAALCGPHRPDHFDGVTTIVSKLFAVTGECVAVFGRKDYQQLKVIERMTRDLLLPVEIVGLRTLRDADGLALSSRNAYLTAEERERALSHPTRADGRGERFCRWRAPDCGAPSSGARRARRGRPAPRLRDASPMPMSSCRCPKTAQAANGCSWP